MADMIKFYKGLEASLPATGTNGALYITTDEGGIYLGTGTGMKRLGDFVQVANVDALPAKAHENCLYYCVAENILAKWNGVEWKQVNKQPTVEELKTLLGLGTAAYTDADAYDAAGSAAAVRTYVGDIPNGEDGNPMAESVIAYINKKTDGIATSGNLEALGNRVTTAEGEIDALQEASAKHVEKEEGKSLIADTEIARLAGMSDGANKVEKSETNGNIKVDGAEVVVYTHPEKHAIADVDGLEERIAAIEGNFGDGEGTVESKIEAAVSAETTAREEAVKGVQDEVDAVEGRMDTAEGKITALEGASATHAVKTEVEAALALKADKSVVEAMYTNTKIDELIAEAKKHADDNDADTKYGIVYDSENKKIKLVEGGAEVEIDATDFIKDGMIETVTIGDDNDLVITFNTAAGKENIVLPLDQLVDIYTGVEGARVKVTVASDKSISADLVAGSISKNYLDDGVQASLAKADSALQEHQDISHLATTEALNGVDAKFANYTTTTDMNAALDLKADKTQVATDIATAKGEAIEAAASDAASKYEEIGVAQAKVDALANGQVKTNTDAISELTQTVADNATAAGDAVSALEEKVYTKTEVDALIQASQEWGSF